MPAVAIPVIAGMAAGAGAYAATTITLATAISIGTAVASATMMLTAKKPSLADYRSASERNQVLRAAASDKTCVYGRVVSSGLLSFAAEQAGEQDEGEWLHLALVIAGHKLSRVGDIWLGDDLIGTFSGLVSYELHADRQTCDPFMLAKCADWKEDMIGQGITWLRVSLKFDAQKFPAGLPNIKVEKFGKEVWDPRDGKWKWSDNVALIILDYYRSWLNVPDDEIRVNEFIVAANICDELVTRPDGTLEPRYTANLEFDLGEPRAKVLEALHMACAGQPTYIGGKHGIIAGAYYGPASDEIRSHQIVGDIELLPEPSSSDKINQVVGTFVDPLTFKRTDFPAVIVSEWVEEDGGQALLEDLDLRCVTSEYQAQRLANIMLRQRRAARTLTVPVNLSGWRYRPGSSVKLYIPALGINGPEFRVVDWSFSLLAGVELTLREESPLFWSDAIGQPMERPEITELPSGGVAMPDQLRYEVEQVGEVIQGVLSWRNVGTIAYNQVIIQRLDPGQPPHVVLTAQVPGQSCRVNGLAAGNYVGQVRAIAMTGAPSPVASVSFTIAVPAIPVGVEVEAGNWSLAFRPVFTGGQSYGTLCEWWWSKVQLPLAEVQAKATQAGLGAYMTFQGLQPDTTYYVWLRAVNAYGKSALLAASAKTTYDPASILDILDDQIGAEHLREELRQPIDLIPGISEGLYDLGLVVADIKPIVDRVPEIDIDLTGLGDALTALDERSKQTENLLRDEQDNLGEMGISTALQQDKLHGKLDRVQSEMGDLRDAIFTVNPGTGAIEMDAVRALRDETHASFTEVNQELDAVTGTLATKADHTVVDAQGQRLTEAEQVLDSVNATLAQTVTKSEFTAEQQKLTEVSSSLDAAKGELSLKAAESTVTAQGERLATAELNITANSDANSALAEQVSGLEAALEDTDASIIEVARVSTEADEALALRVSGIEGRTDTAEGKIQALEEVVVDADGVNAGRFDEISAALNLNLSAAEQAAAAAVANTLAGEAGEQRHRQAEASIRHDQQVQLDAHQALASEVTELNARFEGEQADTAARLVVVQEVIAGVEQSTAQQITQLKAEYQEADRQNSAALTESSKALSDADKAQVEQIAQLATKTDQTSASVSSLSEAVAEQDKALAARQDELSSDVDLSALAAIGNTLADDAGETRSRKASAKITQRQETLADEQQALASSLELIEAEFQAVDATLTAQLLETKTALSTADEALAEQLEVIRTDYKAGDQVNTAAIQSETTARASADTALGQRIDTVQAKVDGNTATIQSETTARANADTALGQRIDTVQAKADGNTAAIQSETTARANADTALGQRIDTVQAKANGNTAAIQSETTARANADTALGQRIDTVLATANGNTAAIQSETTARANADTALGQRIDTVQSQTNSNTAAVQTVATATANLRGEVEAGWYTKAKINGEGGGFGLSVKLNVDGTTLTSFVVDTDVFAVMSRSAGAASKRHPFIIKNGTVFMNHAMMDTAEIGNVIAKYIKVTNLDAATIVNSDFKGGNAGFGRGGPYSGWGEGWNTIIYADGTIRTNRLYAAEGSFTGEVNANSGTFNNVVMRENCQILGKLSVNQIEGDVTRVYALESYVASDRISFTIPAFSRTRNLVISGIEIYARGSTQGGGGDHADKEITNSASCSITVNGSPTSDSVSATGSGSFTSTVCGRTVVIPPNQVTSVTIAFTGGYRVRGSVAMVFTQ